MFNNISVSDQYIHHPAKEQKWKISSKMTLYIKHIFMSVWVAFF
jgi:hypothetical protein